MNPPRVLVTGATGFLGQRTLALFVAAGYVVHALGRSSESTTDVTFHPVDLLQTGARSILEEIRPSHLLHLAWLGDRRRIWQSTDNLAWVAASLRLVLDFHATGGVRAVLAGSSAEYDWSHHTLDEHRTPLAPHTLYGLAKKALFELVSRSPHVDIPSVAWARIFFPFGPHDKPDRLLSQVIDGVARGTIVECSAGTQVRPFLHVDDAAAALVALMSSALTGPVNIALDEICSVRDLVLAAADAAGNAGLVRFGNRPLQVGEPPYMRASATRMLAELGYRPRFTILEGVKRTVSDRLGMLHGGERHAYH